MDEKNLKGSGMKTTVVDNNEKEQYKVEDEVCEYFCDNSSSPAESEDVFKGDEEVRGFGHYRKIYSSLSQISNR